MADPNPLLQHAYRSAAARIVTTFAETTFPHLDLHPSVLLASRELARYLVVAARVHLRWDACDEDGHPATEPTLTTHFLQDENEAVVTARGETSDDSPLAVAVVADLATSAIRARFSSGSDDSTSPVDRTPAEAQRRWLASMHLGALLHDAFPGSFRDQAGSGVSRTEVAHRYFAAAAVRLPGLESTELYRQIVWCRFCPSEAHLAAHLAALHRADGLIGSAVTHGRALGSVVLLQRAWDLDRDARIMPI